MRAVFLVAAVGFVLASNQVADGQTIVDKGCCVAFAMDESTSLTDAEFESIKNFTIGILRRFDRFGRADRGQFAAVCKFSTQVQDVFRLNTHGTNLNNAIRDIEDLLLDGGLTYTHLALQRMMDYLTQCTPDYNQAGLIITDGNSNFPVLTKREAVLFKNSGKLLIVVGLGVGINHDELRDIASPGRYYPVADFGTLSNITHTIVDELCKEQGTTPTTTTTTTTTTTRRPVLDTNPCLKCEFINGLYLFRNDIYCYVFNQCLSWTDTSPFMRPCAFGQFFVKKAATCKPAREVDCPVDPCKNSSQSYPNHLVCSAYFVCANGRTDDEMCCDPGERFVRGRGCVNDPTCTDPCNPADKDPVCLKRPVPGDRTKYQENIAAGVWITRDCAPGTSFALLPDCRCSGTATLPPTSGCTNELYIPFEENEQDYEYRRYVTNNSPKVTIATVPGATGNKAGRFGGQSRLLVKSYDNAWFGSELVVTTRFRDTPASNPAPGVQEALFGNGDCGVPGSIEVRYDRRNNRVNGRLVTYDNNMQEVVTNLSVGPVSSNAWKDVELKYDGSTVTLSVGGTLEDSKSASGNIATRHAALQIGGGCLDEERLTGDMDEFYVYPCIP